uniref:Uncharacterized protein n=1 Tax=Romanomermis culicivorax TaxID=13658 RepID=A0A915JD81_ROMCU
MSPTDYETEISKNRKNRMHFGLKMGNENSEIRQPESLTSQHTSKRYFEANVIREILNGQKASLFTTS